MQIHALKPALSRAHGNLQIGAALAVLGLINYKVFDGVHVYNFSGCYYCAKRCSSETSVKAFPE